MTTIAFGQHCQRFQVFGVYDGDDHRFVLAAQEFDERESAERAARKLMETHDENKGAGSL